VHYDKYIPGSLIYATAVASYLRIHIIHIKGCKNRKYYIEKIGTYLQDVAGVVEVSSPDFRGLSFRGGSEHPPWER